MEQSREYMLEIIQKEISDGKECMIGNCDRLIEKGPDYFDDWITILDLWIEKEKPIQDQSDECIRYIYSLLPPEVRK